MRFLFIYLVFDRLFFCGYCGCVTVAWLVISLVGLTLFPSLEKADWLIASWTLWRAIESSRLGWFERATLPAIWWDPREMTSIWLWSISSFILDTSSSSGSMLWGQLLVRLDSDSGGWKMDDIHFPPRHPTHLPFHFLSLFLSISVMFASVLHRYTWSLWYYCQSVCLPSHSVAHHLCGMLHYLFVFLPKGRKSRSTDFASQSGGSVFPVALVSWLVGRPNGIVRRKSRQQTGHRSLAVKEQDVLDTVFVKRQ